MYILVKLVCSFSFIIILIFLILLFLKNVCISNLSIFCFNGYLIDETRLFLSLIRFFVILISYLLSPFSSKSLNLCFLLITLFSLIVFIRSNIFHIYLFYEASLLPIIYIIIKWGSYPERSLRALILLIYTALFRFPFIIFMFRSFNTLIRLDILSLSFLNQDITNLFSLLIFFAFSVKLPIYGLHFWLPIAHVEAPTFGSIILAGILLKLGGLGLIRLSLLRNISFLYNLSSYLLIFLPIRTLICCIQSDFKRIIAYSSVSHMIAVPILFLLRNSLRNKALLIVIFFHGLSSPLLFILVGLVYSQYGTRQLSSLRGLVTLNPLLTLIAIIMFFITMSAPPFPSFIGEVLFFVSSYELTPFVVPSLILFAFLSIVYNLHWLSSIFFSSNPPILNYIFIINYIYFLSFILRVSMCVVFVFLVSFF